MEKPQVIGLTGGIASGKSSVLRWLIAQGSAVCDSDQLAREVVVPGEPAWEKVVAAFGEAYLLDDGTLNRKLLGELIFGDAAAREKLNGIIHPAVIDRLEQACRVHRENMSTNGFGLPLILDIPLLFEAGLEKMADQVWLVWVSPEVQLQRLMLRDQLSTEAAEKRIAAQMPLSAKRSLADIVIENSGSWQETEAELKRIWELVVE